MKISAIKLKNYLFIVPLLFVVIVKFPHLYLPYFWDEAWSYFPAVYKMYENGPGLLPGALPLWDAKGHPLFFFFLSSLWMKLVGTSVFAVHILPLLISLGTLTATFFLVKKHAGLWAANIAVMLFSVQSLFLAQATMLLPEMLVTLLLLLSTNAYLNKKLALFALLASLMVLTKETSIIFIGGFLLFHFIISLIQKENLSKFVKESLWLVVPIFIYGAFLILHKKEFGSYFFNEHLNYVQADFTTILRKLKIAAGIIFTRYGRIIILAAVIFALASVLIRKRKIENGKLLALATLQIIVFVLFSALNFYTQRYMLSLLALFMVIAGVILSQSKFENRIANRIILVVITAIPLVYTFTQKTNADSDLGYAEVVKTHQQMVEFCEGQGWHDESIATSFNLIFCLRNPHLGYLSSEKNFKNVMILNKYRDAEIFLNECTSYGVTAQMDTIKNENKLIKEFKLKHAWGEIYTNKALK
ncbi:Dolichyl-phosphate-mannose-protein mannosyltransferase [Mariniphaga anaerophila]|uniref:Dolichyl-phosphate-mannose-protein mannosyltransferase n=1 Tax=Mariniphaga anaerophila TaxID=1484053 RepID=A0A1M5E3L6_9BACT|nr:glycosyltransferase family 39 protein [Mariniphaga anaerophila]SHF73823.1 Dolichyl-phosphate-mannose-protein mannosyltransferase [Mariniphaga anaerophila]